MTILNRRSKNNTRSKLREAQTAGENPVSVE